MMEKGKGMALGPARPGLDLEGICFKAWILGRKGVLGWCGLSCGCCWLFRDRRHGELVNETNTIDGHKSRFSWRESVCMRGLNSLVDGSSPLNATTGTQGETYSKEATRQASVVPHVIQHNTIQDHLHVTSLSHTPNPPSPSLRDFMAGSAPTREHHPSPQAGPHSPRCRTHPAPPGAPP